MTVNATKTIVSIYDFSGVWSRPYREAGYNVVQIDLQHGQDARVLEHIGNIYGLILQPPCDHFAGSGARWWKAKGHDALIQALALVDAGLRHVAMAGTSLAFWVLENPVGRLRRFIGPPQFTFNPCDYGDPYTKRTCLWGRFNMPPKRPVEPVRGSMMHRLPPSPERKNLRSRTPEGWARAFFEANP